MVMVNEHSWNSLQSGLRRVKQDIEDEKRTGRLGVGGGANSPKHQQPIRARQSPRLPRLNSAESQSNHIQDLRRSNFNLVPPVHRSFSLESIANPPRDAQNMGVFTPPTYFNNGGDLRRRQNNRLRSQRTTQVPNKSISNFLAQNKSLATSQSFNADDGQNYASIEDHPLSYRRGPDQQYQDNRNSRYSPVYKKRALENQNTRNQPFNLLDESLAPTPVSEAEQKRNIRLRQRGRRGEGVGDPRQRTSLEDFVDKLRNQHQNNPEGGRDASPSLRYKPLNSYYMPYYAGGYDDPGIDDHYCSSFDYEAAPQHAWTEAQYTSIAPEDLNILHSVVDEIVMETLEDDLIPDLLIEVFVEAKDGPTGAKKPFQPTNIISQQPNYSTTIPQNRSVISPPSLHYPWIGRGRAKQVPRPKPIAPVPAVARPMPIVTNRTAETTEVDDPAILAQDELLFRRTFDRFLTVPMVKASQWTETEIVVTDVVDEMMPDIVREAILDVILEDFIDEEIVPEVVAEESREVVVETVRKLDSRVEWKQRRAIRQVAREQLIDGSSLDHLLDLIAKSGRIFTEDQHRENILDDVILTQLLTQFLNVRTQLTTTVRNSPLRKVHEKLVTDVAVDVILEELEAQLDEDLEDLHEYESSLDDPRLLENRAAKRGSSARPAWLGEGESLKLAAGSEALPDGLKDWIRSVDATFAPHSSAHPHLHPPVAAASNSAVGDAPDQHTNLDHLREFQVNYDEGHKPQTSDDPATLGNVDDKNKAPQQEQKPNNFEPPIKTNSQQSWQQLFTDRSNSN
ncbi:uncharacterized protein LOC142337713 isoform X2 [Convolutriloba macropyga]|uniref:uncharacterized protein LOC142337713 isoform X2 n=1 Tax=Convolutriloba macropyga TaxID=536237 RepID=UPI003F524776